jgi:hypothetical protein
MNRRKFVRNSLLAASAATASAKLAGGSALKATANLPASARRPLSAVSGFTFARLRYASGNWDADPKMPSNLLNSLVEYTSIRIDPNERIVDVGSAELSNYPFVYLTGNKMVRFNETERANLRRYLRNGGFMFVDDCNHDIDCTFSRRLKRFSTVPQRLSESCQSIIRSTALSSSSRKARPPLLTN